MAVHAAGSHGMTAPRHLLGPCLFPGTRTRMWWVSCPWCRSPILILRSQYVGLERIWCDSCTFVGMYNIEGAKR